MARAKVYGSSVGPFLYDDEQLVDDQDGDFDGLTRHALMTTGQIIVEGNPTHPDEVARLGDLGGGAQYLLGNDDGVLIDDKHQMVLVEKCEIVGTGILTIGALGILTIFN